MPSSRLARSSALAGSVAAVGAVAGSGAVVTRRSLPWYDTLDRPGWVAPNDAFGPVWAVLYAGQAVAAWLVWRAGDDADGVDVPALSTYAVQLGLNAAWTLAFFGLRRPALAAAEIVVLWVAIAETTRRFAARHRVAAALLVPYLAWTTYAAALTVAIWWRNR